LAAGIIYDESLIQSLEKSLRSAFKQPSLQLTRRPKNPGSRFISSLAHGGKNVLTDDGPDQMVMEIVTTTGEPSVFYFGFIADFVLTTRVHIVQHASLSVFHEICGELVSFFRAEWDQLAAADSVSEHAQPHWHFVQHPERIAGIARTLLSQSGDFAPQQNGELFGGLIDCGMFHFAMVSLSDKNTPSHKHIFQDDFRIWFEKLCKYTAGQIAYLARHAPALRNFPPGEVPE